MTSYPLLTETSLTTDWAAHYHADYLGYELPGWVISLNSILPTPSLDHSTRLGGQTHLLLSFGSSLALMQATLWHHSLIRVELHRGASFQGWRWTSSWTWGRCKGPHEGCGRAGTACRHGSRAGVVGSGPVGPELPRWQWPCSFALRPGW